MSLPSRFELLPAGGIAFLAPPRLVSSGQIVAQGALAERVLRALNTATDGVPIGRCRVLTVFNPDETS